MKRIILALTVVALFGCELRQKTKITVIASYGSGWSWRENYLHCDSINLLSEKEAIIWYDSKKTRLLADRISFVIN